ncbi:MAG: hypothetical protein PHC81_01630 [Clostridia bacterium]|nr:hypothetical protein [Clostridia bacterium]MDD4665243.1 hypothetical protein [Clostridia bacterium]
MKKLTILILIAIVIVCGVGAFAAHQTGYLNLNPILAQIPGMGDFVVEYPETLKEQGNLLVSPIETENKTLRKEKRDLEHKLTLLEGEKTKLLEQVTELQTELTKLKVDITKQETAVLQVEELAAYYQEMKPDAVVKIMDNLDDELILTILPLLEKKQTGKILALMDPQRAAIITQLLLDKKTQQ